uniref:Uncharacterized protein n=1 Tax=Caenorhabditis japonica TaxID=281687 RepID=A0A8R1ELI2_CAEJA
MPVDMQQQMLMLHQMFSMNPSLAAHFQQAQVQQAQAHQQHQQQQQQQQQHPGANPLQMLQHAMPAGTAAAEMMRRMQAEPSMRPHQ